MRRFLDTLYAAAGALAALCVLAIFVLMIVGSLGRDDAKPGANARPRKPALMHRPPAITIPPWPMRGSRRTAMPEKISPPAANATSSEPLVPRPTPKRVYA